MQTMESRPVRRLLRRTDNKMVAGVASGLGDYFGIDPVWFRLGFVLTTFMGGVGILAYIVMWIIMPESSASAASGAERGLERVASTLRGTPAWIGIALVALGGILVINAAVDWRPGVIWGFALIVFGVLFFVQRDDRVPSDTASPLPVPPPPGPGVTDTAVLEPSASGVGPPPPPMVPGAGAPPPPAPRVRERSTLGFMTFGVLLVTFGVLTLLDLEDVINLTAAQYLALGVGVIGIGLLVGSVVGRARWLIVPGLILIPFMLAASLVHVPFEGGFGERSYVPEGITESSYEFHLIAGEMTIDLTRLSGPGPFTIEATTVMGRILIIVPEGASLDIAAKAGAGQVSLFGQTQDGVNVHVQRTLVVPGTPGGSQPAPAPASIEIDVETALGQVEVRS